MTNPHVYARYPFEFKVHNWALQFSHTMTGENRIFLMLLNEKGAIRQVIFGDNVGEFEMLLKTTLTESAASWLFYHPFDALYDSWVEWDNLPQTVLERLIRCPFNQTDFESIGWGEQIPYPESWKITVTINPLQ